MNLHLQPIPALARLLAATLVLFLLAPAATTPLFAQQSGARGSVVTGTVRDPQGATVADARVYLVNAQQAVFASMKTDADGRFRFDDVASGSYELRVTRRDFDTRRLAASVGAGATLDMSVVLEVSRLAEQVTVTAETGRVEDKERVAQQVNVIGEDAIRLRVTDVLAQVANEEPGLALQRTSPTIGGIFVRGLTGKNVAVYVDGVRFTTSAQRGGISTFFNLNEPSSLRAVEVLRGPNSAQYGSDSLGGTVQLVSRVPAFGAENPETHGEVNTYFSSADLAFGGNTLFTYGTRRTGTLINLATRRVNNLRPAGGVDTHSSIQRFLGLRSDILGSRLTDTAFTQYGGTLHFNYAPENDQQLVLHYQRGQQDGGKRYDQTLGGDGNLQADLRNLQNDFFYARYLKQGLGFFDNGSVTASFNSQREERVNQGGRGNPLGNVTHQYERTRVFGLSGFVDKQLARANTLLLGADIYRETVRTPAYTFNPVTNRDTLSRPRIPNGARFITAGLYAQDVFDVVPNHLRVSAALRYNVASYRSRAANAPVVNNLPLFPNDSSRVDNFSGRLGVVATPAAGLNLVFNYSRGFRAPNITDLGTLGLVGNGFEVDPVTAASLGGTIGTTADRSAVSSGRSIGRLRSETSNNFDLGVRYRHGRLDADVTGFLNDLNDSVFQQTLILPPGATGQFLGDQRINEQLPGGAVIVGLSTNPVLVRSNFADARIYGLEATLDLRLTGALSFGSNFTIIRALDKTTGRPPNIEGGTPPANGFVRLRFEPSGKRYFVEGYATLADRQNRLSSLDLSDRRTGATRSRNDIRDFFRNGACVRGLVAPGPDGRCATGDETTLLATNETLAQVQTRVLGTATAAPLFTYIPGYGILGVRGGFRLGESSEVFLDFTNITDQTYRGLSWGIDGPGRGLTARYLYRF